jgi:glycosyltransferase involved in cell wall biosynthesis
MTLLSIITINRNNATGLDETMRSVISQTDGIFEYIVIDGASIDGSIGVIKKYTDSLAGRLKWISEPDNGIYNAMNKGIRMASGNYVQFLNSGDCLASNDVTERMTAELKRNDYPSILYGNMLKDMPDGRVVRDRCFAGQEISFLGFYTGTLNHSPAYIRKDLFDKYGLYDENLRIVSDWKWYLQAIILGEEKPVYTDIDVTLFDMHGISETNKELDKAERKKVLGELIPQTILSDYDSWAFPINQMKRLKRHPWAYKLVWFLERCLFKIEKWGSKCKQESIYQ